MKQFFTTKQSRHIAVTATLATLAVIALTIAVFQTIPQANQTPTSMSWHGQAFASWQHNGTAANANGLTLAELSPVSTRTAKLTSAREGAAVALNPETNKIYIFGGVGETSTRLTDILEYDIATDTLVKKNAELPIGKSYISAIWDPVTKVFYIVGGAGSAYETNDGKAIVYNPATDTTLFHPADTVTFRTSAASIGITHANQLSQISIFGGGPLGAHGGAEGTALNHAIFLPNVPAGSSYLNPYPAPEIPNGNKQIPFVAAAYDAENRYAYIIASGTSLDSPLEVYAYNVALGYIERVNVSMSGISEPRGLQNFTAVYVPTTKKVLILGGNMTARMTNAYDPSMMDFVTLESDTILELSVSGVGSPTGATGTLSRSAHRLPTGRTGIQAVWSPQTQSVFVVGGRSVVNQSTDPTLALYDDILEYKVGVSLGGYASTGTASTVYTPLPGVIHTWKSAMHTSTLQNQSLTVEYSNDTTCTTGFTPTITELAPSESICIRAVLGTDTAVLSPLLQSLTITFETAEPPAFPPGTDWISSPAEPIPFETDWMYTDPASPDPLPLETEFPTPLPTEEPTPGDEVNTPITLTSLCIENIELKNRPTDRSHTNVRVTITDEASSQIATEVSQASITTSGRIDLPNIDVSSLVRYRVTIKPEGYLSQTFVTESLPTTGCLTVPTLAKFRAGDFRDNDDRITLKDISAAIAARSATTPDAIFQLVYSTTGGKPSLNDIASLIADYKATLE